ncbi:MAG: hypothetical protein [Wendovervirus sonii]|uniref:Uncharacterized protein n=1 Tax=phage Lak_Megaphage_Sonny TaxID=3109229 RepID=A0ABZ0Z4H7_9CAUD|nr:MAG: hypothetical protein [phage Lak_Megaphage_Sonny]
MECLPISANEFKNRHAKLKTFSEITDNDILYIIDIDNAYDKLKVWNKNLFLDGNIAGNNIYTENKCHKTYPEYKTDDNYEYDEIQITVQMAYGKEIIFNAFDDASFVFDWERDYILCACVNGANTILELLKAKCNIQALKFKNIFNGKL